MQQIRIGVVSTVNAAAGTVRVAFPDLDNMVSGELPVLSIGRLFAVPEPNDNAVCLLLGDGLGAGFFLGSFYAESAPDTTAGAVLAGSLTVTGTLYGGGRQ